MSFDAEVLRAEVAREFEREPAWASFEVVLFARRLKHQAWRRSNHADRYAFDPAYRRSFVDRNRARYQNDAEHRERVKATSRARYRSVKQDPALSAAYNAAQAERRRRRMADPAYRERYRAEARARRARRIAKRDQE